MLSSNFFKFGALLLNHFAEIMLYGKEIAAKNNNDSHFLLYARSNNWELTLLSDFHLCWRTKLLVLGVLPEKLKTLPYILLSVGQSNLSCLSCFSLPLYEGRPQHEWAVSTGLCCLSLWSSAPLSFQSNAWCHPSIYSWVFLVFYNYLLCLVLFLFSSIFFMLWPMCGSILCLMDSNRSFVTQLHREYPFIGSFLRSRSALVFSSQNFNFGFIPFL